MSELPDEVFTLAEFNGISREDVETAYRAIRNTPFLPTERFCLDGQEAGKATVRVGREYDTRGEENMSVVIINAPEVGHQIAFWVNRNDLIKQLGEL